MILKLDCKVLNNKADLLAKLQQTFSGMYSLNYDSLIDGARDVEEEIKIEVVNVEFYEDAQNLIEVLQIISQENTLIKISVR